MHYLDAIEQQTRTGMTQRELKDYYFKQTGHAPPPRNLRTHVARFRRDQNAINAGAAPTPLWKRAHRLT